MPNQTENNTTTKKSRGRPPIPPEVVARILSLAREGWMCKAIAQECGVSDRTVTTICHKNGFRFPRGGDRRSEEARSVWREVPGWVYDKPISSDLAATCAGSAYTHGQLRAVYHGQRALPTRLKKIFDGEASGFVKI